MVVNASGWRKTSNTRLEALIAFSVCSFQILFFYSWREGSQNELLEWMKAVGRRGKIVPFSYYVVIIILKQKKTIRGVTFFIPKFNCIVRITRANKFIYGNCILLVMCRLDIFWFGAREEDGIWSDDDDEFSRMAKETPHSGAYSARLAPREPANFNLNREEPLGRSLVSQTSSNID